MAIEAPQEKVIKVNGLKEKTTIFSYAHFSDFVRENKLATTQEVIDEVQDFFLSTRASILILQPND